MNPVNFISEVSSNHSQDLERCLEFVRASKEIGCGSVKFQLFKVDELFAPEILKKREDIRQRKQWELPVSFLPEITKECRRLEIQFSCTPFYLKAVEELAPYVDFLKVASYELLWKDLLRECARTKKPVILSTGMATLEEVVDAHETLVKAGATDITLLHCNSGYPTPIRDANLNAIETIRKATGAKMGWSDHTVQPAVIYRAIHKFQANTVEFHLDLDGKGDEFKTGHCWLPQAMKQVIQTVNDGFLADGNGEKKPSPSEIDDRIWRADPSDGLRPFLEMREKFRE
ncbi:MAG: N-acetylneuraminic acid synthase [Bdellovibrio sp. CG10_big_fil_rev_8_21_14_0_10_47_8]|nr:MAG: N-acetylneuraminic acid synthase [Bdellovibrio sp. CG10_big_fil_rev_8_21_14_0_10_47_8]